MVGWYERQFSDSRLIGQFPMTCHSEPPLAALSQRNVIGGVTLRSPTGWLLWLGRVDGV